MVIQNIASSSCGPGTCSTATTQRIGSTRGPSIRNENRWKKGLRPALLPSCLVTRCWLRRANLLVASFIGMVIGTLGINRATDPPAAAVLSHNTTKPHLSPAAVLDDRRVAEDLDRFFDRFCIDHNEPTSTLIGKGERVAARRSDACPLNVERSAGFESAVSRERLAPLLPGLALRFSLLLRGICSIPILQDGISTKIES